MNDALKHAIDFARRGWYVFPIKPNTKFPYKGFKWRTQSTNDPEKVLKAGEHENYKGCNWAVDCGRSKVFIADHDTYKPDYKKPPFITKEDSETFTVKTARRGFQCYYNNPGNLSSTTGKLSPAFDTKGDGGYALIPGSTFSGGVYSVKKDLPLRDIPEGILNHSTPPAPKEENWDIPVADPDLPHNVQAAINYLKNEAPEAIEGDAGDARTYQICCRLRDLNLTEAQALDLLLQYWNEEKAIPPWDADLLEKKVQNAYQYAKSRPGNKTPEALFPDTPLSHDFDFIGSEISPKDLKPMPWVLGYRYLRGAVTGTVAPGGTGKSLLTILEALAICSGKQLTHDPVREQGKVWLHSLEEPLEIMKHRVLAAAKHHKLTKSDLSGLCCDSSYGKAFKLAMLDQNKTIVNEKALKIIIEKIKRNNILLYLLDPLIKAHYLNENDNPQMDVLMNEVFNYIASETNATVGFVHHANKSGGDGQNLFRGATSIVGSIRIGHVLVTMTPSEAKDCGVPEDRHEWFVRMVNAKKNYSPPTKHTQWYEKASEIVVFGNSDTTGTIRRAELSKIMETQEDEDIMDYITSVIQAGEEKSITQITKALKDLGFKGAINTVKTKLKRHLKKPYYIGKRVYKLRTAVGQTGYETYKVVCRKL